MSYSELNCESKNIKIEKIDIYIITCVKSFPLLSFSLSHTRTFSLSRQEGFAFLFITLLLTVKRRSSVCCLTDELTVGIESSLSGFNRWNCAAWALEQGHRVYLTRNSFAEREE